MSRGDYDLIVYQVDTFDGDTYEGEEALEHLTEADQVFYSITYGGQESFYRWVAGPFEDLDGLEAAIEEEANFYSEISG